MSSLSQFYGSSGIKPSGIVMDGLYESAPNAPTAHVGGSYSLSGSCTAATLKTLLSVTGRGALAMLGVASVDATSRTHRLKITLDGTVIYDKTSTATTTYGLFVVLGYIVVVGTSSSGVCSEGVPLLFDSSLLIEYASSVTETDKTKFFYKHYLR